MYFDDCPNYEALPIADEETAQRERFIGSPTVRIDGRDVEPGASDRRDFCMRCRLYETGDGLRGTPLDDWRRTCGRGP